MKVYNLNIDTSKPTNQTMQMQQNATGLLNANITNDGKYIRNLSCTLYDGANEIEATTSADSSFGFKVDVGAEPKHVKVVAKSTPYDSVLQYVSSASGGRPSTKMLSSVQINPGVYNQDEFLPIVDALYPIKPGQPGYGMIYNLFVHADSLSATNFGRIELAPWTPQKLFFYTADGAVLKSQISASEEINVLRQISVQRNYTLSTLTYPSIGYYTDYQLDTLVKPSDNAPYDGDYVESVKEIEVDGVKFVPTTLSVDGVEYKVLAEVQPAPDPEEPTTNDGE